MPTAATSEVGLGTRPAAPVALVDGRLLRGVGLVVGVLLMTTGCGNFITTDVSGATGVTVDDSGRPLIVGEICQGSVVRLVVSGPNLGDGERNETRADLRPAEEVQKSFLVDPAEPGQGWSGQPLQLPLANDLHIALATDSRDDNQQLRQVTFYSSDIADLSPGTVQYGSAAPGVRPSRTTTAKFRNIACDG